MNQPKTPRFIGRTRQNSITLQVLVSNGNRRHDTRLKFEFSPGRANAARVWLVKLPALRNPDAFPRQVSATNWELRLNAVAETQPFRICNYSPENAHQWLADAFEDTASAPCELLILAHREGFTVTVQQSSQTP
jgi:hypothetical protein